MPLDEEARLAAQRERSRRYRERKTGRPCGVTRFQPTTPPDDPARDADAFRTLAKEDRRRLANAKAGDAAHLEALRRHHPELDPNTKREAPSNSLAATLLDVLRALQAAADRVKAETARLDAAIAAEVARQRGDKPLH